MKSYKDWLTENERTYCYKIRIADDVSDDMMNCIENALKAYDCVSVSKPKRLPIQENPINFEGLGPVPVNIIEVELKYPTTDRQIHDLVVEKTHLSPNHVFVGADGQEPDKKLTLKIEHDGKPILLQDYDASDPKVRQLVGDEAIKIALKNAEKVEMPAAKAEKVEALNQRPTSTNEIPQGTMSPVGSRQNSIPNLKKLSGRK